MTQDELQIRIAAQNPSHPLRLAAAHVRGNVFAGRNVDRAGCAFRVSPATCGALVRRGLLECVVSPDGGRMYRITERGREIAREASL